MPPADSREEFRESIKLKGSLSNSSSCSQQVENPRRYTRFPTIILKRYFSQAHIWIDKRYIWCIVNSAVLKKLSLSEGGGGWRKTFKSRTIQIRIFLLKVRSISIFKSSLWLKCFKGPPNKKPKVEEFNPDKAKPSVRWGQKAAGLFINMTELPRDEQ